MICFVGCGAPSNRTSEPRPTTTLPKKAIHRTRTEGSIAPRDSMRAGLHTARSPIGDAWIAGVRSGASTELGRHQLVKVGSGHGGWAGAAGPGGRTRPCDRRWPPAQGTGGSAVLCIVPHPSHVSAQGWGY